MTEDRNTTPEKTDFLLAASCGIVAGIIDVIFVGDPGNSMLQAVADKGTDQFVIRAARFFYDFDKRPKQKPKKKPDDLLKSISYLEQAFPVNYDARFAKDLKVDGDVLKDMAPKNHHLKSLAHSPDIIGLIFSIIDQYNSAGKASFIDRGKLIRAVPDRKSKNEYPYFYGSDHTSKFFCGFVNWFGHLLSDMVGSSSSRQPGKEGRGMGIPVPFFELSQLLDSGDFDGNAFAQAMCKVYEEGYDFRFGVGAALPVVIEELFLRCVWTLRQRFYYRKAWTESLPSSKNSDFRFLLLISTATFNIVDSVDASVRAVNLKNGVTWNWLGFLSRLNYIGLTRMAGLIVKECAILAGDALGKSFCDPETEIFDGMPDSEKAKMLSLSEQVRVYMECTDFRRFIAATIGEYNEARKMRLIVGEQTREEIARLESCRTEMIGAMEDYFSDYLEAFDEGFDYMDQGLVENDSDRFISGNNIIQTRLGTDPEFESQSEFDVLMDSEKDFNL